MIALLKRLMPHKAQPAPLTVEEALRRNYAAQFSNDPEVRNAARREVDRSYAHQALRADRDELFGSMELISSAQRRGFDINYATGCALGAIQRHHARTPAPATRENGDG